MIIQMKITHFAPDKPKNVSISWDICVFAYTFQILWGVFNIFHVYGKHKNLKIPLVKCSVSLHPWGIYKSPTNVRFNDLFLKLKVLQKIYHHKILGISEFNFRRFFYFWKNFPSLGRLDVSGRNGEWSFTGTWL